MDSLFEKEISLEQIMPLVREYLQAGRTVKFSPKGTSMLPMLRQGIDQVVLSAPHGPLKKYDLPLYQRENGQYVLHRVVQVGESYTCVGDNQFDLEHGVPHDRVIAVMTAFTRGEKLYRAGDLRYWIYCRFWHYSRPVRRFWRRGIGWLRRHLT